jgi:hypothetical protein
MNGRAANGQNNRNDYTENGISKIPYKTTDNQETNDPSLLKIIEKLQNNKKREG